MCSVKTNVVLPGFPLTMAITYQSCEDGGQNAARKIRREQERMVMEYEIERNTGLRDTGLVSINSTNKNERSRQP